MVLNSYNLILDNLRLLYIKTYTRRYGVKIHTISESNLKMSLPIKDFNPKMSYAKIESNGHFSVTSR